MRHPGRYLRASVEYRGNGSYDFGDLLPAVICGWKHLLANARDAAASWGQDTSSIDALKAEVKEKISEARAEQWVINKSVHFNPWANLQAEEFRTVVTAFRELLSSMQCTNAACREFVAVTPKKGKMEAIRGSCGSVNLNLKVKIDRNFSHSTPPPPPPAPTADSKLSPRVRLSKMVRFTLRVSVPSRSLVAVGATR